MRKYCDCCKQEVSIEYTGKKILDPKTGVLRYIGICYECVTSYDYRALYCPGCKGVWDAADDWYNEYDCCERTILQIKPCPSCSASHSNCSSCNRDLDFDKQDHRYNTRLQPLCDDCVMVARQCSAWYCKTLIHKDMQGVVETARCSLYYTLHVFMYKGLTIPCRALTCDHYTIIT